MSEIVNKYKFGLNVIKKEIKSIPVSPGIYKMIDENGEVLYVGKAKNLKKRVSSYFQKNIKSRKTLNLVKNTKYVEHVVVHSESDALLLENSLIKKNQPKYNILLRDDKTYPWICIKNEPFPRVFVTRKLVKDGSQYFGPFTSFKTINTIMGIIKQLYSLRNCNYNLSSKNIEQKKFKVCLEYHLGNCLGGCEGKESLEDYEKNILAIKQILKGNVNESKRNFKKEMIKFSNNQEYEKAQKIKEKIQLLENYQSKSTVVSSKLNNIDVFSIISDSESAFVNFLQVAHGKIIRFHNQEVKKKLNEDDEKILSLMILSIREKYNSTSKNIISHINLENQINLKFIIPRSGDNKKLLDLSIKNAKAFRFERNKQTQLVDPERHINRIMEQMRIDLKMKEEPRHIECFDISNIQGTNNVASCVVFINGKPSKKLYRKFNIKTIDGQNDFGSMQEVVFRRYKRLLDEKQDLPNLIVIDGGKGQLSSAVKSLKELDLDNKISVLGIAKRLEELYFPNDSIPLYLNKKSETLKVIQQLRNEAHRFGVSFHRDKRSKSSLSSGLDNIHGIGENTKNKLLKKFKSISKLKKADEKEIIDLIGKSKAEKVMNYLKESV